MQLRSYLEALITDVETEWGRADPAALPQGPASGRPRSAPAARTPTGRPRSSRTRRRSAAAEADEDVVQVVAVRE